MMNLILVVLAGAVVQLSAQECDTANGWSDYNDYCYFVSDVATLTTLSWSEARDWCLPFGGDLASINDDEELTFIMNMTADVLYEGPLWIGLNQLEDRQTYTWSDGTAVGFMDWGPEEPLNDGIRQCVYMRSKETSGYFSQIEGYSAIDGLMNRPEEAAPPETFNFGFIWGDSDLCKAECLSQSNCFAYTHFKSSHHDPIWETSCLGRSNSTRNMVPNQYGVSGVQSLEGAGIWHAKNCGHKYGFVCKKHKDAGPVAPTPTPIVPGYCPDGYYSLSDSNKCLKLIPYGSTDGVNWTVAFETCRREQGLLPDLASIQSDEEKALMVALMRDYSHGFWLGLQKSEGEWVWTDNSKYEYSSWGVGQPAAGDLANCAEAMTWPPPAGDWKNAYCDERKSYVCQTFKDSGNIIPSWGTTPFPCPPGYTAYWYACYKLDLTPRIWTDAEASCQNDYPMSHLVSLHTDAENIAVAIHADNSLPVWIGLLNDFEESLYAYRWVDGWPEVYTHWDSNEPSSGDSCVVMRANGHWDAITCSSQFASVCRYTEAPIPTTPFPKPGHCLPQWIAWGGHCYFVSAVSVTSWDSADQQCRIKGAINGNLVSIHSNEENNFVYQTAIGISSNPQAWIGLHTRGGGELRWTDGTPVEYVRWSPNEPNDQNGTQPCCEMYLDLWPGMWNDHYCSDTTQRIYVCKADKEEPTTPTPSTPSTSTPSPMPGDCPSTAWRHYGDACYLFNGNDMRSWDAAQLECRILGGRYSDLASILDAAESNFILNSMGTGITIGYWIGLHRMNTDPMHDFEWLDHSPFAYTQWMSGEPNNMGGMEYCAEARYYTGEWNDMPCDEVYTRGYVCKIKKENLIPKSSTPFTNSTPPSSAAGGGLSSGDVAAIIFGILWAILLLGAAGFLLWHFRERVGLPSGDGSSSAGSGSSTKPTEPSTSSKWGYDNNQSSGGKGRTAPPPPSPDSNVYEDPFVDDYNVTPWSSNQPTKALSNQAAFNATATNLFDNNFDYSYNTQNPGVLYLSTD